MEPITFGLLSAIPGLLQTGLGAWQTHKANKMLHGMEDPTMPIPDSVQEMLNLSKMRAAGNDLPGQALIENKLSNNLGNATYNIEKTATSAPEALAALSGVFANNQNAITDIGIAAAENKNANLDKLGAALNIYGDWENQKWINDVLNPYMRKMAATQGYAGSGQQNLYSGISNTLGSILPALETKDETMDIFKTIQGSSTDKPAPFISSIQGQDTFGEPQITDSVKGILESIFGADYTKGKDQGISSPIFSGLPI